MPSQSHRLLAARLGLSAGSLLLLAGIPASSQLVIEVAGLSLGETEAATLEEAIREKDWSTAETILFRAEKEDRGNAAKLRALGIAHYQAGRHFLAARALKRSDRIEPLDSEARHLLAGAMLRVERSHWARAELERLVEIEPSNSPYALALARIHYDTQRFQQGVDVLRPALQRDPGAVEAYDLLGQCLEGLGRHGDAESAFRRAISLDEDRAVRSAWPHFHLGSLLHDLGRVDAAREPLEAAIRINRGVVPAHVELGIVLLKAGELQAAARALETAAGLEPSNAAVQYSLAGVYRRMGMDDHASLAMDRFRELSNRSH